MRRTRCTYLDPQGAQVPAGSVVAATMFSDALPEDRVYYGGSVAEDGRLLFILPDCAEPPDNGANFVVIAPGCEVWTGRGIMGGENSEGPLIQLKAGPNPFRPTPPFQPAPREYAGQMCGVRVPGLPPVPGGAADSSLVVSWFYGRYGEADRQRIRQAWGTKYPDVLLSWPDDRASGLSPQQCGDLYDELIADGFRPCVMLLSKDYDQPATLEHLLAQVAPILPVLQNRVPRVCIGWELNLWLSPEVLRALIDTLAPPLVAYGAKVYVHFSQGVSSWQIDGHPFAFFWNGNVGKLTGLLRQEILDQDPQGRWYASGGICDVLTRFAGNFGVAPDSGFGHPFDDIELEISAQPQFNGTMTEAQGDVQGTHALNAPPQSGPAGVVSVMGSGNGRQ